MSSAFKSKALSKERQSGEYKCTPGTVEPLYQAEASNGHFHYFAPGKGRVAAAEFPHR